jgi:hypothetical protein
MGVSLGVCGRAIARETSASIRCRHPAVKFTLRPTPLDRGVTGALSNALAPVWALRYSPTSEESLQEDDAMSHHSLDLPTSGAPDESARRAMEERMREIGIQPPTRYEVTPEDRMPPVPTRSDFAAFLVRLKRRFR